MNCRILQQAVPALSILAGFDDPDPAESGSVALPYNKEVMDTSAFEALRQRAAWFEVPGRGKIRVTGEDRARLLHAMCTNHVQDLLPGTGCYAFFLTAQGRIVADANVFCLPDYLLLDTAGETKQPLMEHLEKYIIADDVAMHDFTADSATVVVEGPDAEAILTQLGAVPGRIPYSYVEWGVDARVAHCTWTGGPGYSVFLSKEAKRELTSNLADAGVPEASFEMAEALRIANGRPRFGVEITSANIPQETQQMHAVHFSKGCYLGQEIVERVRSRGHVNRLLTPVRATGPVAKGTKVSADGKDVGEILSAAATPDGFVAFAMLRAEALQSLLTADGVSLTPTVPRVRPAE